LGLDGRACGQEVTMRNTIISFIAGILATHLFVSTAGAEAESLYEQHVLRVEAIMGKRGVSIALDAIA
jgi:hypothetical protein